jgi:hypothetical protein
MLSSIVEILENLVKKDGSLKLYRYLIALYFLEIYVLEAVFLISGYKLKRGIKETSVNNRTLIKFPFVWSANSYLFIAR